MDKKELDKLDDIAEALKRIANAVKPSSASPSHDAMGGTVDSLSEAVMGVTAGLARIAEALDNVADAIREHGRPQE